ncbi:alpha/beta fold hydrolase [Herbiconiux sp. VKM Ac-2851]|uniref:alpha/beta fold hydrolase n=1 Tax=Herbiconiux sp. VKM Ac-2851 TaxID=2739025 RepID=UPI001564C1A5|nr:alpha/beta fold hydrolase [Herbiconiux sp. VKM Ac-2851]
MTVSPSPARSAVAPAALPPAGLDGFDTAHSRLLTVGDDSWHYVDTADALSALGAEPVGTVLAVHGNPTWSYLWRHVVAATLEAARSGGPAWRVVAVDQLEMGYSSRSGRARTLPERIEDLSAFTDALGLTGPVVTLGHDWGGVISLGWATTHPESLAGVMLLNTAVHQPADVPIPAPLRLARARGMLGAGSVQTTGFLDVTLSLAAPPLAPSVRAGYRAPYPTAARRRGIGAFVADIPVDASHPSHARLTRLAADVAALRVPALMLWGPRDPIFSDRYLDDLVGRLPHAQVHRFEVAGHLVAEDAPVAESVLTWLGEHVADADQVATPGSGAVLASDDAATADGDRADRASVEFAPLWARLEERRDDPTDAVIELRGEGVRRASWRTLNDRVTRLATGLHRLGVRKGDRVSLLTTPGATLTAVVYACLRLGAVVVVADAGLGVQGLGRALRGAYPDYVIGETRGLAAARALGWPGIRISTARLPRASARALGVTVSLRELLDGPAVALPAAPGPSDPAAILYTSGSTGPAKGVVYTHAQLSAVRDALGEHFAVTPESGLVTGFAPFALLGPALGARSSTPEMDVSAPRTLTARAVAAAVAAASADIVFLSPAAILNVVATADGLDPGERTVLGGVRTVLSTGAPVSERMLSDLVDLMPNATAHAIYGMTECLLVSDITLEDVRAVRSAASAAVSASVDSASRDEGVCVGHPIAGVEVRISSLDALGRAAGSPSTSAGVLGEVLISAPHLKSGYDRLWLTDREAVRDTPSGGRWHRTGDVGHLDADGRLWIEGRLRHVIATSDGPVAPVGAEQAIETVDAVRRAAVVGVGPQGLRQFVAVVEAEPRARRASLAAPELARDVRESTGHPLVAVFSVAQLPTDIRHNSKIDRAGLSRWAEAALEGRRLSAP